MDATRSDTLSRALFASPTRRGIGRALAGFSLSGVLIPQLGLHQALAKRKKKKKCKGDKKKCGKKCIPGDAVLPCRRLRDWRNLCRRDVLLRRGICGLSGQVHPRRRVLL